MDKILPCKVMYNKFHILIYYKVDWSQQFSLKTFWCVKWISSNFCGLLATFFLLWSWLVCMASTIGKGKVESYFYIRSLYIMRNGTIDISGNAQNQAFVITDESQFYIHKHLAISTYCNSNTYWWDLLVCLF